MAPSKGAKVIPTCDIKHKNRDAPADLAPAPVEKNAPASKMHRSGPLPPKMPINMAGRGGVPPNEWGI